MYQIETLRYLSLALLILTAPFAAAEAVEDSGTEASAACDANGVRADQCFDYLQPLLLTEQPCDVKTHQANAAALFDGKTTPAIGGDAESVSERNEPGEG